MLKEFWENTTEEMAHLSIQQAAQNVSLWKEHFFDRIKFRDEIVIDYGTGAGYAGLLLHGCYNIHKYIGIDIAERQLNVAKELLRGSNSDFYLTPIDFSSLNARILLCNAVIQHMITEKMLMDFLDNANASKCKYLCLQIRHGDETVFSDSMDTKESVCLGCHTNTKYLFEHLTNYDLEYESEITPMCRYQYLIYRRTVNNA